MQMNTEFAYRSLTQKEDRFPTSLLRIVEVALERLLYTAWVMNGRNAVSLIWPANSSPTTWHCTNSGKCSKATVATAAAKSFHPVILRQEAAAACLNVHRGTRFQVEIVRNRKSINNLSGIRTTFQLAGFDMALFWVLTCILESLTFTLQFSAFHVFNIQIGVKYGFDPFGLAKISYLVLVLLTFCHGWSMWNCGWFLVTTVVLASVTLS